MHQDGNSDDALKYFELEETAYPDPKPSPSGSDRWLPEQRLQHRL
jgi:hypothetical protein